MFDGLNSVTCLWCREENKEEESGKPDEAVKEVRPVTDVKDPSPSAPPAEMEH